MILLFDNNLGLINELGKENILYASEEKELGGKITSEISYHYVFHEDNVEYFGYRENDNLQIYKIVNKKKENGKMHLVGMHLFFYELKGDVVRDLRPQNKTIKYILDEVLKNTGWIVVSSLGGTDSMNFYHRSKLECFNTAIKKFKGEFKFEIKMNSKGQLIKKVYIEKMISDDKGKWFEYGDKLIEVISEEDQSQIYTAYIGMGKGEKTDNGGYGRKIKFTDALWQKASGDPVDKPIGQDYVEIKELSNKYGLRIGIKELSEVEEVNKLLEETYKCLVEDSRPKLQLKAKGISIDIVELRRNMCDCKTRFKHKI